MDTPTLSLDDLLSDVGNCEISDGIEWSFSLSPIYYPSDFEGLSQGWSESPVYSTCDTGVATSAVLGSEGCPSPWRNPDEVEGSPLAFWGESDHNIDDAFADLLSGGKDAATTPMSNDSSSPSDEEDTAVVSSSRPKRVAHGKTRGTRRSTPAPTKRTVRCREDSPTPRPSSVPSDSVAVEGSGVPSVSSSSRRPSVKVVKVIKSKDNRDATTDVQKVEKNQKNAQLARDNRAKKKQYLEGLENQVKELSQSQACLMKQMEELKKTIQMLTADKEHLQSVIVNASTLAGLLQNIQGVQFRANIGSLKRGSEAVDDHDYSSPHKKSQV